MIIPLLLINSLSTRNTFYLCGAYVGWSTTDRVNDVGGFRMFSILKKFLLRLRLLLSGCFGKQ